MAFLPRPVTIMMFSIPDATHSSTTYWIKGLSTTGSISLGCALVAGRKRVPSPAAGITALRTVIDLSSLYCAAGAAVGTVGPARVPRLQRWFLTAAEPRQVATVTHDDEHGNPADRQRLPGMP